MTVTIIGWYGTETLGDRAILAGIFSLLKKTLGFIPKIKIGSLYPYFTERTINEDFLFYKEILKQDEKFPIQIFDSRKTDQLENAINQSEWLIMGGGPLMHINAMYMVEYAFKYAKKRNKRSIFFGCGVGPIEKPRHQKAMLNAMRNADLIVLRGALSKKSLLTIGKKNGIEIDEKNIHVSLDPSVECLLEYSCTQMPDNTNEKLIAINFREFPAEYSNKNIGTTINENIAKMLTQLTDKYASQKILLVPMHYFHIGNDDRDFLNKIAIRLNRTNIKVQNEPLNLKQTFEIFQNASLCMGMRFHSIIFQTVLNGNNIILDYTNPEHGKVGDFLSTINAWDFYKDRYIQLQQNENISENFISNLTTKDKYSFDKASALDKISVYTQMLKDLS
jgi:polysaccharide pyruvyl transferase WcaK-like protein